MCLELASDRVFKWSCVTHVRVDGTVSQKKRSAAVCSTLMCMSTGVLLSMCSHSCVHRMISTSCVLSGFT